MVHKQYPAFDNGNRNGQANETELIEVTLALTEEEEKLVTESEKYCYPSATASTVSGSPS